MLKNNQLKTNFSVALLTSTVTSGSQHTQFSQKIPDGMCLYVTKLFFFCKTDTASVVHALYVRKNSDTNNEHTFYFDSTKPEISFENAPVLFSGGDLWKIIGIHNTGVSDDTYFMLHGYLAEEHNEHRVDY